ncbi:hypothetical protein CDAR_45751 [Caerostris darwini]|uniref:Secreted protein n=1 Tax=Caerostris darwini TaxID=1538125 RepID=A0AAV4W2N1_9ARAC|nr:hypothetical protein CDAR_45751 [Caerostris darwini]
MEHSTFQGRTVSCLLAFVSSTIIWNVILAEYLFVPNFLLPYPLPSESSCVGGGVDGDVEQRSNSFCLQNRYSRAKTIACRGNSLKDCTAALNNHSKCGGLALK